MTTNYSVPPPFRISGSSFSLKLWGTLMVVLRPHLKYERGDAPLRVPSLEVAHCCGICADNCALVHYFIDYSSHPILHFFISSFVYSSFVSFFKVHDAPEHCADCGDLDGVPALARGARDDAVR